MQDIGPFKLKGLDQRARATITIVDYTQLELKTVTLEGNAVVEGTDWTAATDEATTATSLAAALDLIAGFNAAAVGDIVTVYFDTPGVAGNAKTLTTDAIPAGLTLSGATLAEGVAETFSDTFDYDTADRITNIESALTLTALSGSAPTVDVTHYISFDKEKWFTQPNNFTQRTAIGDEITDFKLTALFTKFGVALGGDAYAADLQVFSCVK